MGWRENIGACQSLSDIKTIEQKPQKEQKGQVIAGVTKEKGAFAPFDPFALTISESRIKKDSARLSKLITMSDNSKGMDSDQIAAISREGSRLIETLPNDEVQEIFKS